MHGGRLFQAFATDAWSNVELNNLNWVRSHQKELRAECYDGFMDRLSTDGDLNDIGKKATILPSTFPGSPRNMKARMQDAMAVVRKKGKPQYFITFTCNPKWPEITALLPPTVTAENRPDLTARVFNLKLKKLLTDLLHRHVLGQEIARTHVIEFQ